MDLTSKLYSKTGKGTRALSTKPKGLSKNALKILTLLENRMNAATIHGRLENVTEAELLVLLAQLERDGYIRSLQDNGWELDEGSGDYRSAMVVEEVSHEDFFRVPDQPATSPASPQPAPDEKEVAQLEAQRTYQEFAERLAQQTQQESEARAREAERKAQKETERLAVQARQQADEARQRAEAELNARLEAERTAREVAERAARKAEEARLHAEEQARAEAAERVAQLEAEAKAREDEARRKAETERLAREKAEQEARRAEAARLKAEEQARAEAAERIARLEAEAKAREDEARRQAEAERLAREKAEQEARRAEDARLQAEARERALAEQAAREAEAARRQAEKERKAREEAERKAAEEARRKAEAEERARVERAAREKAEQQAREEEAARRQAEAERKAAEAQAQAEKAARREAERLAQQEAKRRAREEKEARKAQEAAERQARKAEAEAARKRAREEALQKAASKEQEKAEYRARKLAEKLAKRNAPQASGKLARSLRIVTVCGALVVLALALALPLVNLTPFATPVAQMLARSLGDPVRFAELRASLLPRPQLQLSDVSIGHDEVMHIGSIQAALTYGSLFSERREITGLEIGKATLKTQDLARVQRWFANTAAQGELGLTQFTFNDMALAVPGWPLPPLSGRVRLEPDGGFGTADLETSDRALRLALQRDQDEWKVALDASAWQPLVSTSLKFDDLHAEGRLRGETVELDTISGRLYGGQFTGDAKLGWNGPVRATGRFAAEGLRAEQALATAGSKTAVEGALALSGTFSGQGADAAALFESLNVDAQFTILDGLLGGVDLASTMLPANRDKSTRFDKLTGTVKRERDVYRYRKLALDGGQLRARGQVDVAGDSGIGGKVTAELALPSRRMQSDFGLGGWTSDVRIRKN